MISKQKQIQPQNHRLQPNSFESNGSKSEKDIQSIPLDRIFSPDRQPRRYFDAEAMQQLIASIKSNGILQPLLVRPLGDKYKLVAGERRLEAARTAGLTEVPVTVREMTDSQALQYALVENLQRQDLNPIEETEGILQLLAFRLKCNEADVVTGLYRLENIAKGKITPSASGNSANETSSENSNDASGKSDREIVEQVFAELGRMNWRTFVRTRLPLLKLPPEILEYLRAGRIEWTKAKAIAKLESSEERVALLPEAIAQSLSLRQVQKMVREKKPPREEFQLQAEMEKIFKRAKKFTAWDDPQKCDKLKSLLAELELLLPEEK
ncbi:MAG: ParB/RepB/Spo0J family partition protein [Hormoscilla sp. GM7CHS1pb]|nr:ParB/RepB/Spo0J family partition protein [Hormoscilla sp. GM7CHS1pb]